MENIFKKMLKIKETHHTVKVVLNDGNESFTFKYLERVENETEDSLSNRATEMLNEEYEPWGWLDFEIQD